MAKRMTFKVFLTKLRKLRGQFVVETQGAMIRTREKYQPYGRCLCPIEAVAQLLGEPVDDNSLTLHPRTRTRIIEAADENALGGRTRTFRRQMLAALRLREI